MSTAYVVVTVLAAAMAAVSAGTFIFRAPAVVRSITAYGVPEAWLPWLGAAKAAGAVGLLVGLAVPAIGVAAGVGLVLYFAGAVATVVRARAYAHVLMPLLYAAPVIASLVLLRAKS